MSGHEISTIVTSIIKAFTGGLDSFNKTRARHRTKKRHKERGATHDELRLRESLDLRPRDIRAEYDRNLAKHGERFDGGDYIAHASLANTLLVLSTGLINIVNQALSDDSKARALSSRALLGISEKAATDTVLALDQLNKRLSESPRLALSAPLNPHKNEMHDRKICRSRRTKKPSVRGSASIPREKRPGPDPLMKSAWVRSRSGSLVVTLASSIAGRSHKRTISALSTPKEQKTTPFNQLGTNVPRSTCVCQTAINSNNSHGHQHKRYRHGFNSRPEMLLVSQEVFDDTPRSLSGQVPPEVPPKIPLERSLIASKSQPRPISVATFLTASTKIGEIPEHRWPDGWTPSDEDRQAPGGPLPNVVPHPIVGRKRKGRGFKFWKSGRDEKMTE